MGNTSSKTPTPVVEQTKETRPPATESRGLLLPPPKSKLSVPPGLSKKQKAPSPPAPLRLRTVASNSSRPAASDEWLFDPAANAKLKESRSQYLGVRLSVLLRRNYGRGEEMRIMIGGMWSTCGRKGRPDMELCKSHDELYRGLEKLRKRFMKYGWRFDKALPVLETVEDLCQRLEELTRRIEAVVRRLKLCVEDMGEFGKEHILGRELQLESIQAQARGLQMPVWLLMPRIQCVAEEVKIKGKSRSQGQRSPC